MQRILSRPEPTQSTVIFYLQATVWTGKSHACIYYLVQERLGSSAYALRFHVRFQWFFQRPTLYPPLNAGVNASETRGQTRKLNTRETKLLFRTIIQLLSTSQGFQQQHLYSVKCGCFLNHLGSGRWSTSKWQSWNCLTMFCQLRLRVILCQKMVMQVYPPQTRYSQGREGYWVSTYWLHCNIKDFDNAVSFFCEPSRQELEEAYIINTLRRRKPFTLLFSEFWRILPPRAPSRSTLTSFLKLLMTEVSGTAAGKDCDEM